MYLSFCFDSVSSSQKIMMDETRAERTAMM